MHTEKTKKHIFHPDFSRHIPHITHNTEIISVKKYDR